VEKIVEQVIVKIELVARMHKTILGNVEKMQQKPRRPMLYENGDMFPSFVVRKDMVKMKKLGKKRLLKQAKKGHICLLVMSMGRKRLILVKEDTSTSLKDLMKLSGNNHKEIYDFFILEHNLMGTTKV